MKPTELTIEPAVILLPNFAGRFRRGTVEVQGVSKDAAEIRELARWLIEVADYMEKK